MVERTAALRNLKLLVGTGGIDFKKGMAGMDSLNKRVEPSGREWLLGIPKRNPAKSMDSLDKHVA